jgi:hypothetical protein
MCTGITLALSELPTQLIAAHRLIDRIYDREGRPEFQFHWWQTPSLLPVRRNGRVEILPWGSKSRRGPLPSGGWVTLASVEDGLFANAHAEEVIIPANLGQHKGTWFVIHEGIKAITVESGNGPVVYMLTEPSSNYFRNMTEQSPTMPVFIHQVI